MISIDPAPRGCRLTCSERNVSDKSKVEDCRLFLFLHSTARIALSFVEMVLEYSFVKAFDLFL